MSRILSKARKSDTIVLQASDGVLNVELRNVSRSVPDPVSIPLVDVHHEYQNLGIPEMNNSCLIRMNSGHFKKTVNTMYKSGLSTIALKLQTDKKFIMEDYSHEPNTTRFEFVSGQTLDNTAVSVVCSGEAVEYFACSSYLNDFVRAAPLSSVVAISLSAGVPIKPIKIEYPIGEQGSLVLYLAPKVDEDDDDDDV